MPDIKTKNNLGNFSDINDEIIIKEDGNFQIFSQGNLSDLDLSELEEKLKFSNSKEVLSDDGDTARNTSGRIQEARSHCPQSCPAADAEEPVSRHAPVCQKHAREFHGITGISYRYQILCLAEDERWIDKVVEFRSRYYRYE